jgi:hypothetical protein
MATSALSALPTPCGEQDTHDEEMPGPQEESSVPQDSSEGRSTGLSAKLFW